MPRDIVGEVEFLLPMTAKAPPAPASDDVLRNLVAARAFLTNPDNWWGGDMLQQEGRSCAALAVQKVGVGNFMEAIQFLCDLLAPVASGTDITPVFRFNDSHTHADVLALFDRAIAARRGELES